MTIALFVYLEVVSRHKSIKIDFPLTLTVYQRKISTFVKKQSVMACGASNIKDSILLKSSITNIFLNSVLIVEAKPVKSKITENISSFQIKLIRRLICRNQFYKVQKFYACTTKLRNFIKV